MRHLQKTSVDTEFLFYKLTSLDICSKMLLTFYGSVVASVLFYAAVCFTIPWWTNETTMVDGYSLLVAGQKDIEDVSYPQQSQSLVNG